MDSFWTLSMLGQLIFLIEIRLSIPQSLNGRETVLAEVFRWLMTSDLILRKWSQTNRQALPQCNWSTLSNADRFSGPKTCEDNLYTTRIDSHIELLVVVLRCFVTWFCLILGISGPCPPGHSWRCSHLFWPRHNRSSPVWNDDTMTLAVAEVVAS